MSGATRISLLTAGDTGVGKTSLVRRFCEGQFPVRAAPTVGVDFGVHAARTGNGRSVRANFFDLSGAAAYKDTRVEFWRDVHGALLVYDAGDRASFDALGAWLDEGARYGLDPSAPIVVCGAKAFEKGSSGAGVRASEAAAWAHDRASAGGCVIAACCEVNAASGEGVDAAFDALITAAVACLDARPASTQG